MTSLFEWLCIHWGLHKGRTWSGSYIIYARAAVRYGRASLAGASGHVDRDAQCARAPCGKLFMS